MEAVQGAVEFQVLIQKLQSSDARVDVRGAAIAARHPFADIRVRLKCASADECRRLHLQSVETIGTMLAEGVKQEPVWRVG